MTVKEKQIAIKKKQTAVEIKNAEVNWKQGLICRACGSTITHADFGIKHHGGFEHLQVNPEGITFVFRCYSRAPGIYATGIPTFDHSWFAGYRWQLALCQACSKHLGWLFTGQDPFIALLNDRLKSNPGFN